MSPTILVQRLLPSAQMPRYAHAGAYGDLAADLFAAEAAVLAPVGEAGSTQAVRMMVVPAVMPAPCAAGIQYSAWRISQSVGTPSNGTWSAPAMVAETRFSSRSL